MEIKTEDFKNETIHLLNYYSRYYCRQYIACEELFENQKGHLALFNLLALFENIMKSTLNDFDDTFYNLNLRLKEKKLINELELKFLNDKKVGIRKIRNILAHANLSKYYLEIIGNKVTFPFTENETCLILYQHLSKLLLRSPDFQSYQQPCLLQNRSQSQYLKLPRPPLPMDQHVKWGCLQALLRSN